MEFYHNICRVCMTNVDLQPILRFRDVFDNEAVDLSHKLKVCCNVDVDAEDDLPKHICKLCSDVLTAAYDLVMLCKQTGDTLRNGRTQQAEKTNEYIAINSVDRRDKGKSEIRECVNEPDLSSDSENKTKVDTNLLNVINTLPSKGQYESLINRKSVMKKDTLVCEMKIKQSRVEIPKGLTRRELFLNMFSIDGPEATMFKEKYGADIFNRYRMSCNKCRFSTRESKRLIHHLLKHEPVKQCALCFYDTTYLHEYYNHMRYEHNGVLPFKCDDCPYETTNYNCLYIHRKTHRKNNKFHCCNVCEYKTIYKGNLKIHMAKHPNEMKYQCVECGTSFKEEAGVRDHIKRVHLKIKTYKCNSCLSKYIGKEAYMRHMMNKHATKYNKFITSNRNKSNIAYNQMFGDKGSIIHNTINSDKPKQYISYKVIPGGENLSVVHSIKVIEDKDQREAECNEVVDFSEDENICDNNAKSNTEMTLKNPAIDNTVERNIQFEFVDPYEYGYEYISEILLNEQTEINSIQEMENTVSNTSNTGDISKCDNTNSTTGTNINDNSLNACEDEDISLCPSEIFSEDDDLSFVHSPEIIQDVYQTENECVDLCEDENVYTHSNNTKIFDVKTASNTDQTTLKDPNKNVSSKNKSSGNMAHVKNGNLVFIERKSQTSQTSNGGQKGNNKHMLYQIKLPTTDGRKIIYLKESTDYEIPQNGNAPIDLCDSDDKNTIRENQCTTKQLVEKCGLDTNKKSWICEKCGFSTNKEHSLKIHLRRHEPKTLKQCPLCPYNTTNARSFSEHMKYRHYGVPPVRCDKCPYVTTSKQCLHSHQRIHKEDNKFHCCNVCDYKTIYKSNLRIHMETHTNERKYQCNECGISFNNKSNVRSHIKTVHLKIKTYKCLLCGTKYIGMERYMRHMMKKHAIENTKSITDRNKTNMMKKHAIEITKSITDRNKTNMMKKHTIENTKSITDRNKTNMMKKHAIENTKSITDRNKTNMMKKHAIENTKSIIDRNKTNMMKKHAIENTKPITDRNKTNMMKKHALENTKSITNSDKCKENNSATNVVSHEEGINKDISYEIVLGDDNLSGVQSTIVIEDKNHREAECNENICDDNATTCDDEITSNTEMPLENPNEDFNDPDGIIQEYEQIEYLDLNEFENEDTYL